MTGGRGWMSRGSPPESRSFRHLVLLIQLCLCSGFYRMSATGRYKPCGPWVGVNGQSGWSTADRCQPARMAVRQVLRTKAAGLLPARTCRSVSWPEFQRCRKQRFPFGHRSLTSVPLLSVRRCTGPEPAQSPPAQSREHGRMARHCLPECRRRPDAYAGRRHCGAPPDEPPGTREGSQ